MSWIALAIVLSTTLAFASAPEPARAPAPADPADWCEAARAVAELPPCLDPATCQAVGAWERLVAPPGARLAPGAPSGPPPPAGSRPARLCLADPR